jgi:hypothetical protein
MKQGEVTLIINQTLSEIKQLFARKNADYSDGKDALSNFKENLDIDVVPELSLMVLANKHWGTVKRFMNKIQLGQSILSENEPIEQRIDDVIVYMLILKCLLQERKDSEGSGSSRRKK